MICSSCVLIDLLTDTAAIVNKLDLRNIMGCPGGGGGGMSTSRFVFTSAFRGIFS